MKALTAVGLIVLLLLRPGLAVAEAPGDQVPQSIDQLLVILKDPRLKAVGNEDQRRTKLKEVIYQRFDFTEMARRSLGPEWRRRTAEEQKEFVVLFTKLLERACLNTIESYNGEKVQYLNERAENSGAQVDTKITDNKGRDFLVNYRLHDVNGDWKIYDVVVEDVSLVNNYRAQFSRVLAKSSYAELVNTMKEKI